MLVKLPVVVVDHSVRALCATPYPGHPKGCPNFGKSDRCPPKAPLFGEYFDLSQPAYAVVNDFDLGGHVARMRAAHPDWSDAQLACCLYWQGTARKQLNLAITKTLSLIKMMKGENYESTWCPEGMGVNVTATMLGAGIMLEWPPRNIARQVAILAKRRVAE